MRSDPTFWILARAAGLTAYALLTASMLAGLTLKGRILGKAVKPAAIMDVHRALAIAGLGALALHGVALVLDATVRVTPLSLLVPGLVDYRPGWVAAGVVAGWSMALVSVSFWARKRIGAQAWRALHWLSYVAFVLAALHGLMAGSDSGRGWVLTLYAGTLAAVSIATAWRALTVRRATRAPSARILRGAPERA